MSKLILCLMFLISIYTSKDPENVRVFGRTSKDNEISVRLGEEFALKFVDYIRFGDASEWYFLNKNETQETFQYLRSYQGNEFLRKHIVGDLRKITYFHFKALKKTNEAVTLKFTFGRFWKESKYQTIETFKINVK